MRLLSTVVVQLNSVLPRGPFRWDYVVLNLPGTVKYDPSKPRVDKWNTVSQSIASVITNFPVMISVS